MGCAKVIPPLVLMVALMIFMGVTMNAAPAQSYGICGPMDIVFVVDDTGSMSGALDNVKAGLGEIIAAVQDASGNDYRLALVTFKDDVTVRATFDVNESDVISMINSLYPSGGNGWPEASDQALNVTVNYLPADGVHVFPNPPYTTDGFDTPFRDNATRIIILITDAPPGGFDDQFTPGVDDVNAHKVALDAAAKGIRIVAVYVPTFGVEPDVEAIMKDYADTTGGIYYLAKSDGSDVAQAISSIVRRCGASQPQIVGGELLLAGGLDTGKMLVLSIIVGVAVASATFVKSRRKAKSS